MVNMQDFLNAGLGLWKAGEESFRESREKVERAFSELKSKGAEDTSAGAEKIREALENTVRGVKDVSHQAEGNLGKALEEAKKNYSQVMDQLHNFVGEERVRDLNVRINELATLIRKDESEQGPPQTNAVSSEKNT